MQQAAQATIDEQWLRQFAPDHAEMRVLVCSVSSKSKPLESSLSGRAAAYIKLSHETPLPIEMQYESPDTLGYDRLANAIGARKLAPAGRHALVIDVGTCLKFDFIHAEEGYFGGAISPGVQMRYRSLHRDTHALPLVDSKEPADLIGRNTSKSIHSGVINGMSAEIEGVIQRYQSEFNPLAVFLTGGDAQIFEKALKNDIFAHSFLTLVGLNDILEFNQIT